MRLGSFWGLTAPMLLLAYDDIDEALPHIRYLRDTVNGEIINDLHTELYFLLKSQDILVSELLPPEEGWFSQLEPDAQVSHGQVYGCKRPQDMAIIDLRNEISIKLAQKTIKGEANGTFVDSVGKNVRDMFDSVAMDMMRGDFYVSEIDSKISRLYRKMKSENGHSLAEDILREYRHSSVIPPKLTVSGELTSQGNALDLIHEYFMGRMKDAEKLFDATTASTSEEIKIFGVTLADFLRRDPKYLKILSIQWFKYLSGNRSPHTLINIVDDYHNSLNTLIHIISTSATSIDAKITEDTDHEKMRFAVSSEIENLEDYTEPELQMLDDLYGKILALAPETIAKKLGIPEDVLKRSLRAACDVGICGLNTNSLELFLDTMPNVVMADTFTISKSQEYLDKLDRNIEDAKSLLRNIRALGEVIEEDNRWDHYA